MIKVISYYNVHSGIKVEQAEQIEHSALKAFDFSQNSCVPFQQVLSAIQFHVCFL